MTLADQPTIGPDGQLLDASKIEWYNDPDDAHPIQLTSDMRQGLFLNHLHLKIVAKVFTCCVRSVHTSNEGNP